MGLVSVLQPILQPIILPALGEGGGAVVPAYEGLVATRCRLPFSENTSNKQFISRSAHVATDDITSPKVVFPNFRAGGSNSSPTTDVGNSNSSTVQGWIEYPAGTFTPLTFGGNVQATIPALDYVVSDACAVTIPKGAVFWLRQYHANAGSTFFLNGVRDATGGDLLRAAASGLVPSDAIGTIAHNGGTSYAPPLAIIAQTRTPSALIVGDSIAAGFNDTTNDVDGRRGSIASGLGTALAFLNLGQSGERANNFFTNAPVRSRIVAAGWFSHLLDGYGHNDLFVSGNSKATLIASLQAIWATVPSGRKIWRTTITPFTDTTDSWATTANQTVHNSLQDAVRLAFNADVRNLAIGGISGYFDIADGIESSRDSGLFIASPSPPYTADGRHPNSAGYDLIAASGVVDPTDLVWP